MLENASHPVVRAWPYIRQTGKEGSASCPGCIDETTNKRLTFVPDRITPTVECPRCGKDCVDKRQHHVLEQAKAITAYCQKNLEGVRLADAFIFDESDSLIPLLKRMGGSRLNVEPNPGDHVLFSEYQRGFMRSRDAVEAINRMTCRGLTVHFVKENAVINPDSSIKGLLERMVETDLQDYAEIRRQRAEKPQVVQGIPKLGYKVVLENGNRRLVPCLKERKVMKSLLDQRENLNSDAELLRQLVDGDDRNPRTGKRWSRTTLSRFMLAAKTFAEKGLLDE